jgi:glycerol-1-phosphate dehydrogenase [NAD(P)+]
MDTKERIDKALSISTDTKIFEMGQGVSACAPDVFKKCFPGRKAVVLADIHTWPVLGEKVYVLFQQAGISVEKYVIDKEVFHAEWKYVEMTDCIIRGEYEAAKELEDKGEHEETTPDKCFRAASESYNVLVSVGSGVINDLCKLSSYHHGQSYISLPTAASVDGYSSFGSSITYAGAKQTFTCPAPVAIVADIDVIAAAPKHMTAAGYADLAAKVPAGAEWMIADFVGSEPIQDDAWHILQDFLDDFLADPEGVAAGDPKAVADLFEGLTLSGFAMQAARSSRPASCCDHLFSHIMDMTEHRFNGELQSHGYQVAIGTLTMCAVFDELFKLDLENIDVDACVTAWPTLEQEQQRALEQFSNFPAPKLGYTEITKKYSDKEAVRMELTKLKNNWPELKARLQGQVYSFSKMQELLRRAAAPYDPSHIGVTRQQLKDMFPYVQLMRFRYNILDLAKRGGVYETIVESVFAKGGALEI